MEGSLFGTLVFALTMFVAGLAGLLAPARRHLQLGGSSAPAAETARQAAPRRPSPASRLLGGAAAAASVALLIALHPSCFLARKLRPASADSLSAMVHGAVAPLFASGRVVGVAVGVFDRAGMHVVGFGRARADRPGSPDGDTVFEIGSITKVFTTLLLARLVERGTVRLDEPVEELLPVSVAVPSFQGRKITLEDLATQRSGLPRLPPNMGFTFSALLPPFYDPYAGFDTARLYAGLSAVRLRRAPGEQFEYSNFGVGLLGHALERAAGQSYDELVRREVLTPLGLRHTGVGITSEMSDRVAPGHVVCGVPGLPLRIAVRAHPWNGGALTGAGSLHSSVHDLLGFAAAQLHRSPSALAAAMDSTQRPRWPTDERSHTGLGRSQIGLGWIIARPRADRPSIVWHNGGTGGYRSFLGIAPERGTAVVILANSTADLDAAGFRLLHSVR
jgi:CubicO group peptidase (beta-lactamase class C family)